MWIKIKGCCLIAIIILPFFLAGCRNARDLRDLKIVSAVGIDRCEQGGKKLTVTAQIVMPEQIKAGMQESGGSSSEKAFYNLVNDGNSVLTTFRYMTQFTNDRLYMSHNEAIVFGRGLAESGIGPHLSFFVKDNETRPLTQIFIAEDSANEILSAGDVFESMPSINLKKLSDNQRQTSLSAPVTLHDVINKLLSKTASFVVPIVRIEEISDKKIQKIEGLAVFRSDKMIGELDQKESRGLLISLDKATYGMTPVSYKDQDITLEIISSKSKIKPRIEGQNIFFDISVKINTSIMEQSGEEPLNTGNDLDELEKLQRKVIEEEIYLAFEKAKSLNADIFGFGELLRKYRPGEWKNLEDKWEDAFQSVKIKVTVKNQIRNAGLSGKPLAPEEENG